MKAQLSNHHQSPRKVRLVADAIRGKKVLEAQRTLTFMPKYAAPVMRKLLNSAVANARIAGAPPEELSRRLQTIVDDDKRGRVMSLFIMAFLGASPLGSLLAGALSEKIGPPDTLRICGFFCLAGAYWFYRQLPEIRQAVRPIYVRMGILPQLTEAIRTSTELSTLEQRD